MSREPGAVHICFAFCGSVAVFYGLLLTRNYLDPTSGFRTARIAAVVLYLPALVIAPLGVGLSLVLHKPRGLLLLGTLTVVEGLYLRYSERPVAGEIFLILSLVTYGSIAVVLSGRLALQTLRALAVHP